MNSILSHMLDESLLVYINDLLVFSPDIDLYYGDVKKLLLRLCEHMLKAKGNKYVKDFYILVFI